MVLFQREHRPLLVLFCCICLLSISPIGSQRVVVTVEEPNVMETTSKFGKYGVERFNKLREGQVNNYQANFTSQGIASAIPGRYNPLNELNGTYDTFTLERSFDSAGKGRENTSSILSYPNTTLTLRTLEVHYIGFAAMSLHATQAVEIHWNGSILLTLNMGEVLEFLKKGSPHYTNNFYPMGVSDTTESAAFVNIYTEGLHIDKVVFKSGSPTNKLRTAHHTIGFYIEKSGTMVQATPFQYLQCTPKKEDNSLAKFGALFALNAILAGLLFVAFAHYRSLSKSSSKESSGSRNEEAELECVAEMKQIGG